MEAFDRINKKTYLALCRKGLIPCALPPVCVLIVETDKDSKPNCAKSRIVVLGNLDDTYHTKLERYDPVLKYSSLHLLVSKSVKDKLILHQGNCKNVF